MHPRKRATLASFLLLSVFALAPASAQQVRFVPESLPTALSELLDTGRQLEQEHRWSEAISHYEQALREHPNHASLRERLDLTKIHYDLARRYSDTSFQRSLVELDSQRALDLYSEVLLKINAHWFTAPEWQRLVARGTTSLDVALGEQKFIERNLRGVRSEQIAAFRREMYQEIGRRTIRSRNDARHTVAAVANLAQARLGMRPAAVTMEYVSGALGGLDSYSSFLTGDQLRDVYSQIEGNFVGLGIELKSSGGSLLLVDVIEGSPAHRAGMRPGDRIVGVDGKSTTDLSTDEAAALLQGPEGSTAQVTVVTPGGGPRRLQVRREHVEVPSIVDAEIIDRDFGIGYLKLTSFQKTTTRDLDRALWQLHRDGMRSLVLDLRGNPGGLLTTSVEIADRFIEQGGIVSTRGRSRQEDYNYSARRPGTWRVPLVVLIDGDSASASEIFAGAIRDNRRGRIVGMRSYGKGSVQGIFPLNYAGAGVRLTTAKFFSPAGHPISKVGIEPDIVVRHAARLTAGATPPSPKKDAVLEAGLTAARRQLAAR